LPALCFNGAFVGYGFDVARGQTKKHGKKRCTEHTRDIKAIANEGSIKAEQT
jgi:hypothetical protein